MNYADNLEADRVAKMDRVRTLGADPYGQVQDWGLPRTMVEDALSAITDAEGHDAVAGSVILRGRVMMSWSRSMSISGMGQSWRRWSLLRTLPWSQSWFLSCSRSVSRS
jgi:hypothetical protein